MSLQQRIQLLSNVSVSLGNLVKSEENNFIPIKLVLEPYLINRNLYDELGQVSKVWQKLIYLASKDTELIKRTFEEVAKVDDLVKNVYSIFLKSCENPGQDSLLLSRVDYFKNTDGLFKIIEYNMTATSMHAHSENFLKAQKLANFQQQQSHSTIYPKNTPCTDVGDAVAQMYKLKGLKGLFIMIVSVNEKNIIDQTNIQLRLLQRGIKSKRQSMCRLYGRISKKQNKIYLDGEEVSVVYYRAGYRPADYCQTGKIEQCWKVRQFIQLSDAIKIPDVKTDLMNQKRMQVELSKPEVHSKYLSEEEAQILRKSLVYTTDFDANTDKSQYLQVLEQKGTEKFILKPNLQGGGNNIHGQKVYEMLKTLSVEELKKYILMEKIYTTPEQKTIFFGTSHQTQKCICEISRYGILIECDGKLVKNTSEGYLVRVKPQSFQEGGVIAGYGAIGAMAFQK